MLGNTQNTQQIHASNCAYIIIDMLNDFEQEFINEQSHRTKFLECANSIKLLSDHCRSLGIPIIYISCCHEDTKKSPEFQFYPPHAMKGTTGAEVINLLEPQAMDIQMGKNTYSGFYETDLEERLRKLNRTIIVLSGVHTHVCIQCTALDAFYRGLRVIIPRECVTTKDDSRHAHGLRFVSTHVGTVLNVDELIKLLRE